MRLLHRVVDAIRSGEDLRQDPTESLESTRWRQRILLEHIHRGLDETTDVLTYVNSEIERSREHAFRLDGAGAEAAANGYAGIARELHEKRSQAYACLAELMNAREAVAAEQTRMLGLRKRLTDDLAECDALSRAVAVGLTDDLRRRIGQMATETHRITDEEAKLEAEY